jgi:hypothetical protein
MIPERFGLYQNFPNPFNPKSKIKYQIAKTQSKNQNVILAVYNALGEEIAVLVNEEQSAGTYEVDWDAGVFPSGVYYYKLSTGDFTKTRKMVLVK